MSLPNIGVIVYGRNDVWVYGDIQLVFLYQYLAKRKLTFYLA